MKTGDYIWEQGEPDMPVLFLCINKNSPGRSREMGFGSRSAVFAFKAADLIEIVFQGNVTRFAGTAAVCPDKSLRRQQIIDSVIRAAVQFHEGLIVLLGNYVFY